MIDHAKALADALRQIFDETKRANNVIALGRDGSGQGRTKVATAMHRIAQWADKALTAEAATRENGDLRKLLDAADGALDNEIYDQKRKDNFDAPDDAEYYVSVGTLRKINDLFQALDAALSTHQQQGAESELVKRLVAAGNEAKGLLCGQLCLEAADALSRAPQPDTAMEPTDEMVQAFCNSLALDGLNCFIVTAIKNALTAALSAKGIKK